MHLKSPKFWFQKNLLSRFIAFALAPISFFVRFVTFFVKINNNLKKKKSPVLSICVGNIVLGGAGKTPVVLSLCKLLNKRGFAPHVLSRGYKRQKTNLIRVEKNHSVEQVSDEPLLIREECQVWVGKRKQASLKAIKEGADILIFDDGFQSQYFDYDIKILVFDEYQGIGNHFLFPSGPLRSTLNQARECDLIFFIHYRESKAIPSFLLNITIPIIFAKPSFLLQKNEENITLNDPKRIFGFAGIGFPEKFKQTLINEGFIVEKFIAFPDHYMYKESDLLSLVQIADDNKLMLITTEKDFVKIPSRFKHQINVLKLSLHFDQDIFLEVLDQKLKSLYPAVIN
jgi:tetraacyldisaccharide 4'-kinase